MTHFKDGEVRIVLDEAKRLVAGQRRKDYDNPKANHERIAAIWNVQIGPKLKDALDAHDAAMMQIGLKLAREAYRRKLDNLVDIAGYAQCVQLIDDPTIVEWSNLGEMDAISETS